MDLKLVIDGPVDVLGVRLLPRWDYFVLGEFAFLPDVGIGTGVVDPNGPAVRGLPEILGGGRSGHARDTVEGNIEPVETVVIEQDAAIDALDLVQHPAKGDIRQTHGGRVEHGTTSHIYKNHSQQKACYKVERKSRKPYRYEHQRTKPLLRMVAGFGLDFGLSPRFLVATTSHQRWCGARRD